MYFFDDLSLPTIIIIGGGFGGLQLVKRLNDKPYRVLLLDKHNYHTFQPLLYQIASAGISADAIAFPFRRKIGPYPNIAFRMAEVTEVSPVNKIVHTNIGDFNYDYLIIATGSTTNYFGNVNLEKYGLPLKSIPDSLNLRSDILQEFETALITEAIESQDRFLKFVIVGGGPTGVELAGALAEIKKYVLPKDYTEIKKDRMHVKLIEAGDRLLPPMSEKSSRLAKKYVEQLGVEVLLNTTVTDYDGVVITLGDGQKIESENVIWTAGVKGVVLNGIPKELIVRGNRYKVDAFNRIEGYDNIFAIGDIALMTADPKYPKGHPGVAQGAVQQAKNLGKNFMRMHHKKELLPFRYHDKGSMATIGRHRAVVDLPYVSFGGYLAWYVWMFVHLMTLVGFRNRFMVFMSWMWNYFTYDRALRLIIRPYKRPE
ncbi:MAG: NAD(P)/FAD-dependent oxidoreductase [Bacteroidetes bacterium]|nr:NAD(P)/FAD-dependent oxidoreductase [Bacteroidota bacterium]MBK8681532.1 NAD(P)/FAD-dependent oxidoreductase [Bacteroidota bacterium]